MAKTIKRDERIQQIKAAITQCEAYMKMDPDPAVTDRVTKLESNSCLEGMYYLNAIYKDMQYERSTSEAIKYLESKAGSKQMEYIMFAQEKYSNGETSMQYFEDFLQPDTLYLLDEPEVSLSPANQVALAKEINNMARWLDCQFIIATHSPFMLGTLDAKIYNIDSKEYAVTKWSDLENVRYFYNFFKKNEKEFE